MTDNKRFINKETLLHLIEDDPHQSIQEAKSELKFIIGRLPAFDVYEDWEIEKMKYDLLQNYSKNCKDTSSYSRLFCEIQHSAKEIGADARKCLRYQSEFSVLAGVLNTDIGEKIKNTFSALSRISGYSNSLLAAAKKSVTDVAYWEEIEVPLSGDDDDVMTLYRCSHCGNQDGNNMAYMKYCPYCGSPMSVNESASANSRKAKEKNHEKGV